MPELHFSLNDMDDAARRLLTLTDGQRHFAFYGAMGAGKTTFIKAVCRVLGAAENVTSPTFALVNVYHTATGMPIYHFDFYRIKKPAELYDIGCEEYFADEAYCFIEWPEMAEDVLPDDVVPIRLRVGEDNRRILSW